MKISQINEWYLSHAKKYSKHRAQSLLYLKPVDDLSIFQRTDHFRLFCGYFCLFYSNSIQYLLRKKWLINAPERNNVSSVKLSKEYISTPNKNGFVFYLVLYSWTFSFPFVEIRKSKLHSILCILPLFQSKVS